MHGILVWRLDRLAQKMVDGGEVIYYLSNGDLTEIVTPEATYRTERPILHSLEIAHISREVARREWPANRGRHDRDRLRSGLLALR